MYAAEPDPYCYAGTTVLKNIQGIRDQAALDRFETAAITQRAREDFPNGE
jgi:cell filamentation protein